MNTRAKYRKERHRLLGWCIIVSVLAGFILAIPSATVAEPDVPKADRVVVYKADRRLILMRGGQVLYAFSIRLGEVPEGDKLEDGDWRTPEGRYLIDWRNARSRFYKSLHISYPNAQDRQESAVVNADPGGMIMIHGYPPNARSNPEKYADRDWTNGCIALQNKDMDIVWSAVDDGTPIDIFP